MEGSAGGGEDPMSSRIAREVEEAEQRDAERQRERERAQEARAAQRAMIEADVRKELKAEFDARVDSEVSKHLRVIAEEQRAKESPIVRFDETLERSVLGGAIALDLAGAYASRIEAEDFAHPAHGLVWKAAVEASRDGRVTVQGILAALRVMRRVNAVGGESYVKSLTAYAPPDLEEFDAAVKDFAGGAMARRLRAAAQRVNAKAADDGTAPADLATWALGEMGAAVTRSTAAEATPIHDVIYDYWQEIERRNSTETPAGVTTGLTALDRSLSRMRPGQLVIVAGRPGSAKTSLAMHATQAAAAAGTRVLVWSLEMPQRDLVQRLLCAHARLSISAAVTSSMTREQSDALTVASAELARHRERIVFIDHEATFEDIEAGTLREHQRSPVGLVVIDHLQHVAWSKHTRDERQHLGRVAKGAKRLAKKIGAPIMLLSQLSRKIEERDDKRPMLSDLFGSGEIEAAADVVLGIYRDEYYDRDSPQKGNAELGILKQRDGATGTVTVRFDAFCTRFSDTEEERGWSNGVAF